MPQEYLDCVQQCILSKQSLISLLSAFSSKIEQNKFNESDSSHLQNNSGQINEGMGPICENSQFKFDKSISMPFATYYQHSSSFTLPKASTMCNSCLRKLSTPCTCNSPASFITINRPIFLKSPNKLRQVRFRLESGKEVEPSRKEEKKPIVAEAGNSNNVSTISRNQLSKSVSKQSNSLQKDIMKIKRQKSAEGARGLFERQNIDDRKQIIFKESHKLPKDYENLKKYEEKREQCKPRIARALTDPFIQCSIQVTQEKTCSRNESKTLRDVISSLQFLENIKLERDKELKQ